VKLRKTRHPVQIGRGDGPGSHRGRPGQIGRPAVTTAVEKAADAPEGQPRHEPNGHDIEITAYRQLAASQVHQQEEHRRDNAAEKLQAAPPDGEDAQRGSAELIEVMDYEEETRAERTEDQRAQCALDIVAGSSPARRLNRRTRNRDARNPRAIIKPKLQMVR